MLLRLRSQSRDAVDFKSRIGYSVEACDGGIRPSVLLRQYNLTLQRYEKVLDCMGWIPGSRRVIYQLDNDMNKCSSPEPPAYRSPTIMFIDAEP